MKHAPALLFPMLLAGCAADAPRVPRPATISHVVLFKLQDPSDRDELIADCDELLTRIPSVVAYAAGRPLDVGRETVDDDYDVGLYVGFDSAAGYADYVDHPLHAELVEEWKPRLEWLRVHDVMDETP